MSTTPQRVSNRPPLAVLDGRIGRGPTQPMMPAAARTATVLAAIAAFAAIVATAWVAVPLASGIGVALLAPAAFVDLRDRRIPDFWVAMSLVSTIAVALVAGFFGSSLPIGSMGAGAVVMGGPLLVAHLISPASMGFGDVKAAVALGVAVGVTSWPLALSALALAAGSTVVVGVVTRQRTVPFGPGLVAGSAIALAAAPIFMRGAA